MDGRKIAIASDTIDSTPLFSYSGLLSVSATLVRNWAVIFLGAEDGRLIKLVLDENMKVLRPSILIELQDDSPIKHSIMFDKIDPHYFYLLTERMVRRLKVANCSQYSSCEDCLLAQDPYCGWCLHEERSVCTKQPSSSNTAGRLPRKAMFEDRGTQRTRQHLWRKEVGDVSGQDPSSDRTRNVTFLFPERLPDQLSYFSFLCLSLVYTIICSSFLNTDVNLFCNQNQDSF
ncbi:plexin-D1-like [Leucoraja erinacea]|uniref:plexin-D1-like n=1 Tax=Leucoraja erinaceus TaxID=7782 RepID=UPI002453BA57|nr:plexin-D1-like [Leucoraja erinacea]